MSSKSRSFSHLSLYERQVLYRLRAQGKTFREIGKALGRGKNAAGSLSREYRRNRPLFKSLEDAMTPAERAADAHE